MQVGGRSGLVAIVVAVTLGAAWAPAASGAGSLEYVISKEKKLPAGKVAFKRANCPNDTKVTGGGIAIVGGNTATAVRSSFPVDDGDGNEKPDDGWVGEAVSRSAGDKKIVVVAICSRTGRFSYVVTQALMAPTGQTGADAVCPTGEPLAGGGVALHTALKPQNEGLIAAAMVPSEGGFFAVGNNQTNDLGLIEAYAICANSGSYEYIEREETAPDGARFGVAAPCPNGTKVTGGGVDPDSTSVAVEVAHVFPFRDGGQLPDDGWQGTINNNNTGGPVDFSTWAVCRD